jgi:neutral amino acid transport system permease protein
VSEFVQLLVNGLVTGSIFAVAAIGISLIYAILRLINFAHGDYLTFGAYGALIVNSTLGGNLIVSTAAAMIAGAGLSVALEFAIWRPMRRLRANLFSLLITGIGLAFVLRHLILMFGSSEPRRFDVDVFQVYEVAGVRFSQSQLVAVGISSVAIVVTAVVLARTRLGKAMRALSDNPNLAAISGIDVDRIVVYTWIVAGALAGLGGVLAGLIQVSFTPNIGFLLLLPVFSAVVLGGIGSAYGALIGGLVLGIATELSTWEALAGGVSPVYKQVVAFAVLILVLLVRPQGVLGRARVV